MKSEVGKCNVCGDVYTTIHVKTSNDAEVFICSECIEKTKDHFIWLCLSCGKAFIRPKDLVISRIKDHELKRVYMLCRDSHIIHGIDACIACNPELIVEYMEMQEAGMEC